MHTEVIALLAAFALAAIAGPIYIPLLTRMKFGQTVRDDGPQTHLKKNGTPTIGGLIFLTPLVIVCIFLCISGRAAQVLPLLFVTIGFGFVGFLDDFIKVVKKRKDGLLWYQKMAALLVVACGFAAYMQFATDTGETVEISLFGASLQVGRGYFYIPFVIFVLLAATNAVNLTDGLDGLCAGSSFIVFMFFTAVSMFELINGGVSAFSAALAGSLLGFMIFNYHPARVFMGDTGSLALGGAMAACALVLKHQFMLVSAGLLFVIETLSVMLQIGYFKLTKGKRLFKMAPIHHHFEQLGYTEIKVTYAFWLFTFLCCIITYIAVAM